MYLKGKKALVIDDLVGMRSSLRTTIGSLGIETCDMASSAREAVEKMRARFYDLILCDYYLGDETDGQQLLELVRRSKIISHKSLFIIVTAERSQDRIVAAADFLPDDYLVKPFTAEVLGKRVVALSEKKDYFHDVFVALDDDLLDVALKKVEPLVETKNKYWVDAMRLKGETLLKMDRYADALKVFDEILALKEIPWATMGKVKALKGMGDLEQGQYLLAGLLGEHGEYLAGYDMLAEMLSEKGDRDTAQKLVEKALEVAPVMHRQKTVGRLALESGDYDKAEKYLSEVVERGRYSYFKEAEDYTMLSSVHIEKGDTEKAREVLDMVGQRFKESPELKTQVGIYKAMSWQKEGKPAQAKALLEPLLADSANVPAAVKLDLAKAAFLIGDRESGERLVKETIKSNHDDTALKDSAVKMMEGIGLAEGAKEMVAKAADEVVALNNQGVLLAREGKLEEAAALLVDAVKHLPDNVTILLNAASVMILSMRKTGANPETLALVDSYLAKATSLAPHHKSLGQARDLRQKLESSANV
ncbi:MAG: response regulator [Sulfuricella sp.]|nr:response regulator [Sulfuricella sp.]